jgi:hypothetical protein
VKINLPKLAQHHKQRLNRWLVLSALILNLSLAISYLGLWIIQAQQGNLWRADFTAFYTGWAIVRDGKGADVYDLDLEMNYQRQILSGNQFSEGLLPFINPPHVALVGAPLAYLSLSNAYLVWFIFQAGLVFWLFSLLSQLARDWLPHERKMMLITAAALPFMFINFLLGAFSLLILVCTLQFVLLLQRNRQLPAGVWLLVGLVKPQAVVLLGVVLLASRRWRALYVCLCGTIILFLVPSLVLGRNIWFVYFQRLTEFSSFYGRYSINPQGMYNLRGTLTLLFGEQQAAMVNTVSIVALFGSVLAAFILWRGPWHRQVETYELRMAMTLLLGVLFNLHVFPQDGVLLIAPAALYYDYLRRRGQPRLLYASLLLICPTLFIISEFTLGGSFGVRLPVVIMALLLYWMFKSIVGEKHLSHNVY